MIKKLCILKVFLFIIILSSCFENPFEKTINNFVISAFYGGGEVEYLAEIFELAPAKYKLDPRVGAIIFKVKSETDLSRVTIMSGNNFFSGYKVSVIKDINSLSIGENFDLDSSYDFSECIYDYDKETIKKEFYLRVFSATANFKDYIVIFETKSSSKINLGAEGNQFVNVPAGSYNIGYTDKSVSYDSFYISSHLITNIEFYNVYKWGFDNHYLYFDPYGEIVSDFISRDKLIDFIGLTPFYIDFTYMDNQVNDMEDESILEKKYSLKLLEGYDNFPVVGVTHFGALAFCWLSNLKLACEQPFSLKSQTYDISKNGYRLPTEVEWEAAARYSDKGFNPPELFSGTNFDKQMQDLSWNFLNYKEYKDRPKTLANYRLVEVGKKEANALGLYDIYGNVAEWVADSFSSNYMYLDGLNYLFDDALSKVIKGGSVYSGKLTELQPGQRMELLNQAYLQDVGFRVARTNIFY